MTHPEVPGIPVIDRLCAAIGRGVAWLALLLVATTFAVVVLRYGFDRGLLWMQESTTWMHALLFMLGAAWALRTGDHVRVDVFYRKLAPRRQALVDLLGTALFLLPLCGYIFFESWPYVLQSWQVHEASREAGGLRGLYLLKSVIPLTAALLALQGLSEIVRALRRLGAGASAGHHGAAP